MKTKLTRREAFDIVDRAIFMNQEARFPYTGYDLAVRVSKKIKDQYDNDFYGEYYDDGNYIYPFIYDYIQEQGGM